MLKRLFIIALALNAMSFAADGKEGHSQPAQAAGAGAGAKKLVKKDSSSSNDSDSDAATTKSSPKKSKAKTNAAIHLDQLLAPAVAEAVKPLKKTIKESARALTQTVDTSAATLSAACAEAIKANAATATQALTQAIKENAAKVAFAADNVASGRAWAWNGSCFVMVSAGAYMATQGKIDEGRAMIAAGALGMAAERAGCNLM